MKIVKSPGIKKTENTDRPKCPRCGRFLKPTEIKTIREGGIVICACAGKFKKGDLK